MITNRHFLQIGPQNPDVQHIAVSHHGLRLIKRSPNGDLTILETLPLEDIITVQTTRSGVCTLQISSGVRLPLHTNRALQLAEMIGKYIRSVSKLPEYCISPADVIVYDITMKLIVSFEYKYSPDSHCIPPPFNYSIFKVLGRPRFAGGNLT